MKRVLTILAKGVLITLGLLAVALVAEATIHKKILGSATALKISNEEMEIFK